MFWCGLFVSEKRTAEVSFYLHVQTEHRASTFFSLPVTGRSEKAGLTGTVDSTWLPVVGQKAGSGHRCLVHTSVMIPEPAEQSSTISERPARASSYSSCRILLSEVNSYLFSVTLIRTTKFSTIHRINISNTSKQKVLLKQHFGSLSVEGSEDMLPEGIVMEEALEHVD